MPMCPVRHYEMPECGEIDSWHYLVQFNCCGLVSAIEEANIRVLQHSGNLEGWEMGDIQYELGLWIVSLFFLLRKLFYLCAVPGTSIRRVVLTKLDKE